MCLKQVDCILCDNYNNQLYNNWLYNVKQYGQYFEAGRDTMCVDISTIYASANIDIFLHTHNLESIRIACVYIQL